MKILVIGYYDRANLGDEMFKLSIPKLLPETDLKFICVDDIKLDKDEINNYDAVVCGGGDIVNDYFNIKFNKLLSNFNGPIYGVGIGIPYPGLIKKGYLDIYDHVFVRSTTDILKLQRRLGSHYVHYLPDMGFTLKYEETKKPKNKIKKVGVFLIQSVFKYKSIVYSLCKFLENICKSYEVTLYRFNTSGSEVEDDKFINGEIYNFLKSENPNLKNDEKVYKVNEMLNVMGSLDYGVCMRFHSHIFSTIAGLPFISIFSTRKVELYVDEENYDWKCKLELDSACKPLKFDHVKATEIFYDMVNNSESIKLKLKYIKNKYNFLLDTKQVVNLIKSKKKRPKEYDILDSIDIQKLYAELSDTMFRKSGYDPRKGDKNVSENTISIELSNEIASKLCMDITNMPNNKYLFGTIKNVMSKPYDLKEMIKWIHKDFSDTYYKSCNRINLDAYCQDASRGLHRSGWQYVVDYIRSLHSFNGVICDMYCDATFLWGNYSLKGKGVIPYTSPWIGFIHHCPDEEYTEYNTKKLLQNSEFQQSLVMCKGLFCLTDYLANWIHEELEKIDYGHIRVNSLRHPTISPKIKFSIEDFKNNSDKKLINVGAWYRNPFTIHRINPGKSFRKCALKGKEMNNYFYIENEKINNDKINNNQEENKWMYYMFDYIKNEGILKELPNYFEFSLEDENIEDKKVLALKNHINDLKKSVEVLTYLPNDEYDKVFSENVIFLNLVDASAANTIIECIVRNTPILINKLEPVVEYLGEDYPLYYENINEIEKILTIENVIKAGEYLQKKDKNFLSIEYFIDSFKNKDVYETLVNSDY